MKLVVPKNASLPDDRLPRHADDLALAGPGERGLVRLASAGAGFGDEGVRGRCHSLDRDNCSLTSHRMPSASRADRRAQQGQNAHRCGRAHRLEIPTRPCGLCKEAVLTPLPPTNDDGQMDLQEPGEQETFLAGAGLTACGLRRTAPPAGLALRPGLARVPGAARALRPGPRGPVPRLVPSPLCTAGAGLTPSGRTGL